MTRPKAGENQPPAPPTFERYLEECTFRDISIPVGNWDTSFTQTHAVHQPVDRDGAFVETTGRGPRTFTITAPFYNHIYPGEGATWQYGNLFPNQYRRVLAACEDRTVGVLKHPTRGQYDAKVTDWREAMDPQRRSGLTVTISFIETIKPTFDTTSTPVDAGSVAIAYDQAITRIKQQGIPVANTPGFFDLVNDIKAFIDGKALFVSKIFAKIDRILYQIDRVNHSIKSAADNTTAEVVNQGERLKEAIFAIRQAANQAAGQIRRFTVPRDMTMAKLVELLGNDVAQLIRLNPDLVGSGPVIRGGTSVRYMTLSNGLGVENQAKNRAKKIEERF